MKTTFPILALFLALTVTAQAQLTTPRQATQAEANAGTANNKFIAPATLAGWSAERMPQLGFVANTPGWKSQSYGALKALQTRWKTVAKDNITHVMLGYQNAAGAGETVSGTAQFQAAVEYPAGTVTPITFGGSTNGSAGTNAVYFSDLTRLAVTIPFGATFWVRTYSTNNGGIIYENNAPTNSCTTAATAGTGLTAASFSGSPSTNAVYPMAIIGYTTKPSYLLVGDSRVYGVGETGNALYPFTNTVTDGLHGYSHFVGANNGVVSIGIPGETAGQFISNHAAAQSLATYSTAVITEFGINGMSTNYLNNVGDTTNIAALFPGKKIYAATIEPATDSSDSFATTQNQTPRADRNDSQRQLYNKWLRSRPAGLSLIDVAAVAEYGVGSVWNVTGFTTDGLHGTLDYNLSLSRYLSRFDSEEQYATHGSRFNADGSYVSPTVAANAVYTNLTTTTPITTNSTTLKTALQIYLTAGVWAIDVYGVALTQTNGVAGTKLGLAWNGNYGSPVTGINWQAGHQNLISQPGDFNTFNPDTYFKNIWAIYPLRDQASGTGCQWSMWRGQISVAAAGWLQLQMSQYTATANNATYCGRGSYMTAIQIGQ